MNIAAVLAVIDTLVAKFTENDRLEQLERVVRLKQRVLEREQIRQARAAANARAAEKFAPPAAPVVEEPPAAPVVEEPPAAPAVEKEPAVG